MSPLALTCVIFALVLGGIFLGTFLRGALPGHHLTKETQDVVRLGAGLIATMAALVLGLLIGAAKASFDTRTNQVRQLTANVILLDNVLAQYGPETTPVRKLLRDAINPIADRLWHEKATAGPFTTTSEGEKLYTAIHALSPQNELQRPLQARAMQVANELSQTRLLLFVEADNLIPTPFLAILVFWLVVIFLSFSLFSDLNATSLTFLCVFGLSASCAIYLILELNQPFNGLMRIADIPLRNALAPL
ncbi:MAG TPA: hypothetical protein VI358_04630 [Pseudolabrys sp.]|jgi:hypothetical protein